MNLTTLISRRTAVAASTVVLAALAIVPTTAAAAAPAAPASVASVRVAQTPSDVLASTPWKTTGAFDQDGSRIALDDPAVANFVGWAYFRADGTYAIYNLDDSLKLHGDWTVTPDGSERWINAKNDAGQVLFQRVVPIIRLDKNVFTYRVFPNAADTSVYYDIVHTRTNHVEPGTDGRGPGANGDQGADGDYHYNSGNSH
ncbi:DUF4822 domain-containing protein [Microbacterium hydrocarbonoxydans]|uniref:DUF4822 domain-containing protein n=1 Tax=Microbacterium hydrocarbonoxydans TaxID=273678 RepID=UPI0013DC5AE6|nr:DUF4822 domain-containing protein [Microbacterium hydrocarbonoxydans]